MSAAPLRDPAPLPYRLVRLVARALLRAYYPDLVIEGESRVPDGPLLVAANHPNSLMDPVLVSVFMPRKIHWLAKHTLFGNRFGAWVLASLGAVPVKRRHEGGDQRSTDETIRAAADAIVQGKAIGIFPEGRTHDEQRLGPLKTGVGRMAVLAARDLAASGSHQRMHVLPVVLHFTSKTRFRTGALACIGRPLEVSPHDAPDEVTERVRREMAEVLVHVDDEEQERLLHDARVLVRRRAALDPAHSDPKELHRVDREVARAIRRFGREEPERLRAFAARLRAYVEQLEMNGLSLHSLEESREPPLRTWAATALLPVALWGALWSGVPYWLTRRIGMLQARASDRTTVAMYAVLTGAILFPLFWLAEAAFFAWRFGAGPAALFLVTAPVTGLVARWTFHVLRRQLGRVADMLLIASHPRAVRRLRAERAWLWSEIERWQRRLQDPETA